MNRSVAAVIVFVLILGFGCGNDGGSSSTPPGSFSCVVLAPGPNNPANTLITGNESSLLMMHISLTAPAEQNIEIKEITLAATGTGDDLVDISAVALYNDTDGNGSLDGGDIQIGSAGAFDIDNGTVVFSSMSEMLLQGETFQWLVVCDYAGTAEEGVTFILNIAHNSHVYCVDELSQDRVPVVGAPVSGCVKTVDSSGMQENECLKTAVLTPWGPQSGNLLVSYVLADDESLLSSLSISFSRDGGETFSDATQGPGGDGVSGLNSSPEGVSHVFYWDSMVDMPGEDSGRVVLRITPLNSHGIGLASMTGCFVVENNSTVNHAPVARFAVDKCHGKPVLNVNFDASGSYDSDGDELAYSWHFGTKYSYSGSGESPSKSYSSKGFYLVTLTVTDTHGLESTVTHPIYVREQPVCPAGWLNYTLSTARILELEYSHPDIARVRPIGVSWENRVLCCLEITDNPEACECEAAGLIQGLIHGNEYMAGEVPVEAAQELLNNYGTSYKHTHWVNFSRIVIAPCVNPDGNLHNQRKNMRDNGNGSFGVDLNRNFPFRWGATGSSPVTAAWNYRGPGPASEPETKAVMALVSRLTPVWDLSFHSYGNYVLIPYTASGCSNDDQELLMGVACEMASLMSRETGGPYDYDHNMGSICSGTDIDWIHNTFGTAAYVVEVGGGNSSTYDQETRDIRLAGASPSWRYMLDRVEGPGVCLRVTDSQSGEPVHACVSFSHLPGSDGEEWHTCGYTGIFHKFLLPGSYLVEIRCYGYQVINIPVTVTDKLVEIDVPLIRNPIGNHKPTAAAASSKLLAYKSTSVSFSSEGSKDPDSSDSLSYTWDFGDGSNPSHQANPVHSYSSIGTYMVKLTVNDGHGGEDTETIVVCVVDY